MVNLRIFAAAHVASALAVVPRDGVFRCPVTASVEFMRAAAEMSVVEAKNATFFADTLASNITVQTYFHVVAASESLSDGYISDSQLQAQLVALNEGYAPYGFQFTLAGTTRTINSNWASDGAEITMKQSLRKGDYKTLNIYFQKRLKEEALGYGYLPARVTSGNLDFYADGISILSSTVPGGTTRNYNLGKTAVHEVGHWLGLLHTFEGNSCTGPGDQIDDTPQQLSSTSGCPTGRDSCPNAPGLDPIHNYMDYSYDTCYEEFTPNQKTRMLNMWNTYRA